MEDPEARKIRELGPKKGWEDIKGVFYQESLPYVPDIIRKALIIRHYDTPLTGHFGIEKTRKLIAQKYYWLMLRVNVG